MCGGTPDFYNDSPSYLNRQNSNHLSQQQLNTDRMDKMINDYTLPQKFANLQIDAQLL